MATGNDVGEEKLSEIREKYRLLLNKLKEKKRPTALAGIIPRKCWGNYEYKQGQKLNGILKDLCKDSQASFIDLWDSFRGNKWLLAEDGVHLSDVGNARLGRLLDEGYIAHLADFHRRPKVSEIN